MQSANDEELQAIGRIQYRRAGENSGGGGAKSEIYQPLFRSDYGLPGNPWRLAEECACRH